MKIALFSDIHGNSLAFDAVLHDLAQHGSFDGFWVLGDFSALGHDPVGVLERLQTLPNLRVLRGNTDRYILTGERPWPSLDVVQKDPPLISRFAEVAASFAWTTGAVVQAGWLDWFADLPFSFRQTLPDGTRVLAIHAAPDNDIAGYHPGLMPAERSTFAAKCDADLVFMGHTHWMMDEIVDDVRLVNLGSVSNSLIGQLDASYSILIANADGFSISHHQVVTPVEQTIQALTTRKHPGANYILKFLQGEIDPFWLNDFE